MNRRRLLVVIAGLVLVAAGVVARSVQISVFEHSYWAKRALKQYKAGRAGGKLLVERVGKIKGGG